MTKSDDKVNRDGITNSHVLLLLSHFSCNSQIQWHIMFLQLARMMTPDRFGSFLKLIKKPPHLLSIHKVSFWWGRTQGGERKQYFTNFNPTMFSYLICYCLRSQEANILNFQLDQRINSNNKYYIIN